MKILSFVDVAPRQWLLRAVVLSALAGMIHMLMGPVYFEEWLGYGAFFFGAASAQILFAMILAAYRPNRLVLWAGILGNAAIVALWAVTRTVGIPFFGPQAGVVQPVGVPDALATLIEVALIVHLAALLDRLPHIEHRTLVE